MDYIAFPHNSFGVPLRKYHHPALGTMAEPLWSGDDVLAHSVGNVMAHGNLPRLHMSIASSQAYHQHFLGHSKPLIPSLSPTSFISRL